MPRINYSSTTDAGATKVTVNGRAWGLWGAKEALSNVVFYPQTATPSPVK